MDPLLQELLVCTTCRGALEEKGMFLACQSCGIAFPVLWRSVPLMLAEEAWPLRKAEKQGFRHRGRL